MFLRCILATVLVSLMTASVHADLLITGVIDGPLTSGTPKAIELYALNDIPDLSLYGLGVANDGQGSDGEEFTGFSGSLSAGDFIYVASESNEFSNFFEFTPDFTNSLFGTINGNDAIELFFEGDVIDVFGEINWVDDGNPLPWGYRDGWAYRVNETFQDGTTFEIDHWYFSGEDALDGESDNATADTPFPLGTYRPFAVPEPGSAGVLALTSLALLGYRRRR